MLKNREFRWMIVGSVVITGVAALIGKVMCGMAAALLVIGVGMVLVALAWWSTCRRYRAIDELSGYLVKVLAGEEAPDILDQEEGELSLLKTNIYKATTTLCYQKELISNDKKALANAMADISHQLKTPLTSMMVMNDLLKTEKDREKRLEFLETSSKQLDRMNWLIQTLLKLSKIDAGTISMKEERVPAQELIKEVLGPFEVQMDLKNISIKKDIQDISFRCDRNWTIEAVQNIVKNCIEHMENGGELHIGVRETNIYTEIEIQDTGCGIASEDLGHIFERFYKGKNAGKDSVGIGLALAKSIITSQHGDILVESTENVGSRFFVRFYKTIL